MKTISMGKKDVAYIVKQMMSNDAPNVCDDLEVLDSLLQHERDFIIVTEYGVTFTKEKMKKLRESIGFDPRGR